MDSIEQKGAIHWREGGFESGCVNILVEVMVAGLVREECSSPQMQPTRRVSSSLAAIGVFVLSFCLKRRRMARITRSEVHKNNLPYIFCSRLDWYFPVCGSSCWLIFSFVVFLCSARKIGSVLDILKSQTKPQRNYVVIWFNFNHFFIFCSRAKRQIYASDIFKGLFWSSCPTYMEMFAHQPLVRFTTMHATIKQTV